MFPVTSSFCQQKLNRGEDEFIEDVNNINKMIAVHQVSSFGGKYVFCRQCSPADSCGKSL